jgi:hypothetical protein
MDFELFYEEIEGFGLVYAFEKIWQLLEFVKSCNLVTKSAKHTR